MKAVVCQNGQLSVQERPEPKPGPGQVLLKVLRCVKPRALTVTGISKASPVLELTARPCNLAVPMVSALKPTRKVLRPPAATVAASAFLEVALIPVLFSSKVTGCVVVELLFITRLAWVWSPRTRLRGTPIRATMSCVTSSGLRSSG